MFLVSVPSAFIHPLAPPILWNATALIHLFFRRRVA
jgi:hypothetical protein